MSDKYGKFRLPIYEYLKSEGFEVTDKRHQEIKKILIAYVKEKVRGLEILAKDSANGLMNEKIKSCNKNGFKGERRKEKVEIKKEKEDNTTKINDMVSNIFKDI